MGRVVVGVDGSKDSATALRWAVDEALLRQDSLVIVHALYTPVAVVPFGPGVVLPPTEELHKYGDELLSAAASLARTQAPGLDVSTDLVVQPPAAALLATARGADVVVVGSRGLGTMGAVFLGSVSTRVAARSSCPTVVVRAGQHPGDHVIDVGHTVDSSGPVVVGVDGSSQSDAAIRFAFDEARLRHTSVSPVYAHHVPISTLPMEQFAASVTSQNERQAAERELAEMMRPHVAAAPPKIQVNTRVLMLDPADALVSASEDAALTVVGSRGRGAFSGMLLGSVSQRLLHHAHGPVAVVHENPPDERDDVP